MPAEVVWTRRAETDLQSAYEVLEARAEGTGERLLLVVDGALAMLRMFPEIAPHYDLPIRRMILGKTNYGIFYTVENRGIILLAIQDLRQDPGAIKKHLG